MLGYVTIGTRDLPRAVKFYDAIANRIARIAWKLMVSGEPYDPARALAAVV